MSGARSGGLTLFAVDADAVQVAWARLGPGSVRLAVGDHAREIDLADGAPGVASFLGLPADTDGEVVATGPGVPGGRVSVAFRTLAPLPGRELYRFATVSDLHLGSRAFGVFHTMREHPEPDEVYTVRHTRAAFAEAKAWGAQRLVAKGDITNHGELYQWEMFGRLTDEVGLPVDAVPGNHDVEARREIDPDDALEKLGLEPIPEGWRIIDVPGLRLLLLDSTRFAAKRGDVSHLHDVVRDALTTAGGPVWIGMHHHLERFRVSYFYPPGVRGHHTAHFLDEVRAANPATFITSGHTHRNRRRDVGPLVLSEVGSTAHYPATWAAYTVHEGGVRQVVWRIADPALTPWIQESSRAAGTLWGRWAPGRLSDRCFNHLWEGCGQPS